MKALVLGGSRFIGLHLVQLLHGQGYEVFVLNRGHTRVVFPDGVQRIPADRTNASQISVALKNTSFDAVFDISGYTLASLKPVVEALYGQVGHFVFCSTTAVYAPGDTVPIYEDFPLFRASEVRQYAKDKIECEDLLMEAFTRRGFPVTILRPPYVYGPDNYIKEREFSFFARLMQGRKIIIPGDGLTPIHLVHVDDLVEAFASVPGRKQTMGQAYSVCGPDAITATGYVRAICEAMEVGSEIVHIEPGDYEALEQQIFPYEWSATHIYSIEKARRDLEWSPKYRMADGLDMTYRWWRNRGLDRESWDFSHEDMVLASIR